MNDERTASAAMEADRGQARTEGEDDRVRTVSPDRCRVWEDEFHVLHLELDGQVHSNVRPVRVFPVSRLADYVSFLDEKGREVALMARPRELDKPSRRTLRRALEKMYYAPRILRVLKVSETAGVSLWEVETDCGYASFEVTDREHIRHLPGGRYLIHDADGNRFEIPNVNELDPESWKLVQSET